MSELKEGAEEANEQVRRFYGDSFRADILRDREIDGVPWFRAVVVDARDRLVPTAMERSGLWRTARDAYGNLARSLRGEPDARAAANREAVRVYGTHAWVERDDGGVRVFCHAPRGPSFYDDRGEAAALCRLVASLRAMPDFPEDGRVSPEEAAELLSGFHAPADLPPSIERRLSSTVIAQAREIDTLRRARGVTMFRTTATKIARSVGQVVFDLADRALR